MITMQDIAKRAGVSTATVSRVLNKHDSAIPISSDTKKKVLDIAKELGYSPNMYAKTLRTKKSMLLGLVVWDLTDFFFSDILRGIENTLHYSGYNLLLNSAEADADRERSCIARLRDLHVDGILLVGGSADSKKGFLEELGISTGSTVLIGASSQDVNINSVTVDNFTGGYIGMEYLINMRRRKLVYLAGTHKTTDMQKRLSGVRRAVEDRHSSGNFELREVGPGEKAGYEAAQDILADNSLPAAIFAVSDLTAFGVIRAVKDRELRVPEDVAVLGYDDISLATYFHPRLSTIRQPRYEMGEMGATILLESIEAKKESNSPGKGPGKGPQHIGNSRQILLSPELITRESS